MKTVSLAIVTITSLAIGACSNGNSEADELAQIEASRAQEQAAELREEAETVSKDETSAQAQYERAVECAAVYTNISILYLSIGGAQADDPQRAAQAQQMAQSSRQESTAARETAIRLGSSDGVNKNETTVNGDVSAATRAIGDQIQNAADFRAAAREQARQADQCRTELAAM